MYVRAMWHAETDKTEEGAGEVGIEGAGLQERKCGDCGRAMTGCGEAVDVVVVVIWVVWLRDVILMCAGECETENEIVNAGLDCAGQTGEVTGVGGVVGDRGGAGGLEMIRFDDKCVAGGRYWADGMRETGCR